MTLFYHFLDRDFYMIYNKGFKFHAWQILVGIDQLVNAILGGYADETLSSRCYRNAQKYWYAKLGQKILDLIFLPFGREHCKQAYESELNNKHLGEDYQ